mgnify:FL=1
MDKLKFETPDIVAGNIDKIAALFPSAITEMRGEDGEIKRGVNFEVLKQLLSQDVVDGDECYEFTWVGKKAAMAEAARPITKTLRPVKEDSRDWDTTENLYIEGDNLEVLKLLQESYLGKVKMIYIDPPYNTGHDFVYPDSFVMDSDEYNAGTGYFNEDGSINYNRENSAAGGRYHSDWCNMIYSRLMLARNLLMEDGVIFISIDDNEQDNLKKICNEVFGASNFIAEFVIASNSSKNNSKFVSITHEYVICYAKEKDVLPAPWAVLRNNTDEFKKRATALMESGLGIERIHKELLSLTKYPRFYEFDHYTYVDKRGPFRASDLTAPGSKAYYDIIHPLTGKPCKTGTRGWAYSQEAMSDLIKTDYVLFGIDETVMPQLKNYLFENEKTLPKSVLFFDSQSSTKWMKANQFGFDYPKAVDFIEFIISMYPKNDCTVLDFFSGSATTAHAVMQLNAEDGGHRKFIMVQLPEKCDESSEAYKAGYKNICEIGKERIRRAGDKIKAEHPDAQLDTGFRVFRVDESNMEDVYYHPEELTQTMLGGMVSNIKSDRSDLDLLYACLLDWGVEINLPHSAETLDGCTIHNVDDGALVACFDENVPNTVIRRMADLHPLRAVFRDSSFASDDSKINVTEIFKNLSPDTNVKVI